MLVQAKEITTLVNRFTHNSLYRSLNGSVSMVRVLRALLKKCNLPTEKEVPQPIEPDSLARIIEAYFNSNTAVLYFFKQCEAQSTDQELGNLLYDLHFYTLYYPTFTYSQLIRITNLDGLYEQFPLEKLKEHMNNCLNGITTYQGTRDKVIRISGIQSSGLREQLNKKLNVQNWGEWPEFRDKCMQFINQGAFLGVRNRQGFTFLHYLYHNDGADYGYRLSKLEEGNAWALRYHNNEGLTPLAYGLHPRIVKNQQIYRFAVFKYFLELGADPNTVWDKNNILHRLIQEFSQWEDYEIKENLKKFFKFVESFLKYKGNINAPDGSGKTVLYHLLEIIDGKTINNCVEGILSLLEHGADPDTVNSKNETALHLFIKNIGKVDLANIANAIANAKEILKYSSNINLIDNNERTAFSYLLDSIIEYPRPECISIVSDFLSKGASPDTINAAGMPLLYIVLANPSLNLIELLLEYGCSYTASYNHMNALQFCLEQEGWGMQNVVSLLSTEHFDSNTTNRSGENAIHRLISSGQCTFGELFTLFKLGVDPLQKNQQQETAEQHFLRIDNYKGKPIAFYTQLAKIFLRVSDKGKTNGFLHKVILDANPLLLKSLQSVIDITEDINYQDSKQKTALYYLVEAFLNKRIPYNSDLLDELINAGADKNLVPDYEKKIQSITGKLQNPSPVVHQGARATADIGKLSMFSQDSYQGSNGVSNRRTIQSDASALTYIGNNEL